MLDIAFIFDRCRRSSAAMTPVKYECDLKNITCTFARLKILLTEKLTKGALVTPTPGMSLLRAPHNLLVKERYGVFFMSSDFSPNHCSFNGHFTLVSSKFLWSDCYKILHDIFDHVITTPAVCGCMNDKLSLSVCYWSNNVAIRSLVYMHVDIYYLFVVFRLKFSYHRYCLVFIYFMQWM